jgi:TfoX/Sxy family transcriptional regulator of competence genes
LKKDGTVREIAYWSLPATAADDGEEASSLARRSYDIALRVAAEKAKKPAAKKTGTMPKATARPKAKK